MEKTKRKSRKIQFWIFAVEDIVFTRFVYFLLVVVAARSRLTPVTPKQLSHTIYFYYFDINILFVELQVNAVISAWIRENSHRTSRHVEKQQ